MKIIVNSPPVYCIKHGAFLEDCWLTEKDIDGDCIWVYET